LATITPKENYFRLARGEMPEYVPLAMSFDDKGPSKMCGPMSLFPMPGFNTPPPEDGWNDMWGVPYVANKETGYAGIPKPGAFILEDITKWDKVIKKPSIPDNIDWEQMAKHDLEASGIDREKYALSISTFLMPFQQLMGLMGFNEGLCALIEEPESVKELLNYMVDFYEPIIKKTVEYYKPDLIGIADDTASRYAPFFSVEIYKDIFKPIYHRLLAPATDLGIYAEFHNCGKCEDFVPDMIDLGIKYWNPAQTDNDLLGIKEKYKGFVICGGWDFVPNPEVEITEELIRQSIRDSLDKYAPGGGYAFCGGYLGTAEDADKTKQINDWILDEVDVYGKSFYKTH
jgi:hypothetical protein